MAMRMLHRNPLASQSPGGISKRRKFAGAVPALSFVAPEMLPANHHTGAPATDPKAV